MHTSAKVQTNLGNCHATQLQQNRFLMCALNNGHGNPFMNCSLETSNKPLPLQTGKVQGHIPLVPFADAFRHILRSPG